jgi:hypothetical protein
MSRILLVLTSLGVLATILGLGAHLPPTVASHFSADGTPDGFMPRGSFVATMAFSAAGVPPLVWLLVVAVSARGQIQAPHAEFWNAPAQRPLVVAFLSHWAAAFAIALSLFLCATFAMVVSANSASGPQPLDARIFLPILALFLGFNALWIVRLYRFF